MIIRRSILYFFVIVLLPLQMSAQGPDTLVWRPQTARHGFRVFYTPILLSIGGIALNGNSRESFKNELVEERNEIIPRFKTTIDNYLQYSPVFIAYGLDAIGISSKTDLANRTAILIKGELAMITTVTLLKHLTHQLRPDGSSYTSFPSGHTAQAFAAATFLSEEYRDRFAWMPYAAYGTAATVGLLRMANNRHYISDVLLGAGIGILCQKGAYLTHRYRWNKHLHKSIALNY
ncbi:MAG: phosphatase PAP2 family protein [Chitinophagaceae bacterium]